ncbi:MAG: glycosyltransferase family 4 protein [Planctomycetota bacterium]
MQLAILHYHLNRGGVTQAILNHLEALAACPAPARPERVALVSSGRRDGWPDAAWRDRLPFDCHTITVPSLEYDTAIGADPAALAGAVEHGLVEAGFDPASLLLHTHNHALGKNASLPGALALLAGRGCRLLLQVHDFAEDFRPTNYRHLMRSLRTRTAAELAGALYPQAPGIHYATLTSRDRALLAAAGVAEDRLHVLPNPVAEWRDLPDRDEARPAVHQRLGIDPLTRLIVYPVRGIRRKNLGEMLLHSALAGGEACYAVTLAPVNPAERASFDRWQSLADTLGLGCRFDVGGAGGVGFPEAVAAADALITTSLAEGFGMVFLEAWLAGKPLVGRNLPEITQDFLAAGIALPDLHDQLRVPMDWLDRPRLRTELLELHAWACRDFGVAPPADTADRLDALLAAGSIDFGMLPASHQSEVITAVARRRGGAGQEIAACNAEGEWLGLDAAISDQPIEANAARVREVYSPAAVAEKLAGVYAAVMADTPGAPATPAATGEAVLTSFLQLDRLRPVRVEA